MSFLSTEADERWQSPSKRSVIAKFERAHVVVSLNLD